MVVTDEELRRRQAESQRAFYRALGAGSPGAQVIEFEEGVQATVVPVRPWFSIFSSVFYDRADALERQLSRVAETYESAGCKAWTVWVPPTDAEAGRMLAAAGHVLDSQPMLMAAPLSEIDLTRRVELDLEPAPTWAEIAHCNDVAHGVLEDWSMAAAVDEMEDPATHLHAVRRDGEIVCGLLAREYRGDCYLWFVATVQDARGRGLAAELLRVALGEARARGCETTTLESTAMAESLYLGLGYRSLGRYEMWERRSPD